MHKVETTLNICCPCCRVEFRLSVDEDTALVCCPHCNNTFTPSAEWQAQMNLLRDMANRYDF